MYLIFDTETNGLPKSYKSSIWDKENWPRIIQLSWLLLDTDFNPISSANDFIYPDGWEIPAEEFWIKNNFTTEKNKLIGIPIKEAIDKMQIAINNSSVLIAHNMEFDFKILQCELIRIGETHCFKHPAICTMRSTTDILQLPGPYGFKWPKLEELYFWLFLEQMEGAHDSMNDVAATAKCFAELRKRSLI